MRFRVYTSWRLIELEAQDEWDCFEQYLRMQIVSEKFIRQVKLEDTSTEVVDDLGGSHGSTKEG